MEDFVNVLPATGSMSFEDYVNALRTAGVRADNWLKAKHAGAIVVTLDEAGKPVVSRPVAQPEGGA